MLVELAFPGDCWADLMKTSCVPCSMGKLRAMH
jgi:hypothetical protein